MGRRIETPAEAAIRTHLASVLPPGVPPMFTEIIAAEFRGKGRHRVAVGRIVMIDGATVTVEVFSWGRGGGTGHRWPKWEGPHLYYENGQWQRDAAP